MQQGNMQKEAILNRLRQRGCRITKQRMLLLDIILEEECSSCKEIYYKASKIDSSIGSATVYRMINMLEEIGAINRRNMYKVSCTECEEAMDELPGGTSRSACTIEFKTAFVVSFFINVISLVAGSNVSIFSAEAKHTTLPSPQKASKTKPSSCLRRGTGFSKMPAKSSRDTRMHCSMSDTTAAPPAALS